MHPRHRALPGGEVGGLAIRQTGPDLNTEKLIDNLEAMRNLDLGLGTALNFGRSEHQASHKIWGTAIDESGKYTPLELD